MVLLCSARDPLIPLYPQTTYWSFSSATITFLQAEKFVYRIETEFFKLSQMLSMGCLCEPDPGSE